MGVECKIVSHRLVVGGGSGIASGHLFRDSDRNPKGKGLCNIDFSKITSFQTQRQE